MTKEWQMANGTWENRADRIDRTNRTTKFPKVHRCALGDDVLRFAVKKGSDVSDGDFEEAFASGAGGPGEVRCDDAVLGFEQRIG